MQLLYELAVFLIIAVIAISVGALAIFIVGIPLQVTPAKSIAFSVIGFGFVFPGTANIWIMLRGSDGESIGERACAGIRGFGMLLCAVAVALPFIIANVPFKLGGVLFVIGSILWWGTVPFEDRFLMDRLREQGVIVEEGDNPIDTVVICGR